MIRSFRYVLLAVVAAASLVLATPAAADTFAVDRTDDALATACSPAPADCSLRGAITDAEVQTDQVTEHTITLPGARITLTGSLPTIDRNPVTIIGVGARQTVIDAAGSTDQILSANSPGVVRLQDLTVTGAGRVTSFAGIGAINGVVDLERVAVVDNHTAGVAAVTGKIEDSLIARNVGPQSGGVVATGIVIRNSTITDNTATAVPAVPGIVLSAGVFTQGFGVVDHSTIANNHVEPGAIPLLGVDLGAVSMTQVPLVVSSSIIASPGSECGGLVVSHGNNIGLDDTCNLTAPGDLAHTDPRLASLADNGGPTDTIALLDGSPAIDAGADCPASDQRGLARALGATCDAGAFESPFTKPPAPPAPPVVPPPVTPPGPPPTTPPPPADKTGPSLTLGKLAKTITRRALKAGLRITATLDEPAVADVTLLAAPDRRSKQPTVELATATLAVGGGKRTLKLKPTARVGGKGRVRARVRVVAYDLAGNRTVRQVDFTIT